MGPMGKVYFGDGWLVGHCRVGACSAPLLPVPDLLNAVIMGLKPPCSGGSLPAGPSEHLFVPKPQCGAWQSRRCLGHAGRVNEADSERQGSVV